LNEAITDAVPVILVVVKAKLFESALAFEVENPYEKSKWLLVEVAALFEVILVALLIESVSVLVAAPA